MGLALASVYFGNSTLARLQDQTPSRSLGTTSSGHLVNGKRLPTTGSNFRAYSRLGALLGRNTVHSAVRMTILDAYAALDSTDPARVWVYGETGWPHGGPFWPHRTHENGLSADFMMPVQGPEGRPALFPTSPFSRFGYDLEFDTQGHLGSLQVSFEAVARHLLALQQAAGRHGLAIDRVIIAPEYQPLLFATPTGRRLAGLPFMKAPAWVRHDEHYHIDFRVTEG